MHVSKQLGIELASNIAAALVVGMILTFAAVSWGRGVIISTLVALQRGCRSMFLIGTGTGFPPTL
jgi:hypothetical protein